jgi:NADH dehydrogenase
MRRRPVRVVVLGAGFAGISAVRDLQGLGAGVLVVDATNHHLFQPLLYQVATAFLSPADIATPIRSVFRRRSDVRVLWARAVGFDLDRRRVRLDVGEVEYDFLVVALGAQTHWFGHDDWASHAVGLKSLGDAVRVRSQVLRAFEMAERAKPEERPAWVTFVVVGGGPTGVEMAGAIAEIARKTLRGEYRAYDPSVARVLLVEAGDRILAAFAPSLSDAAARALAGRGVEVRTRAAVTAIDGEGVTVGTERIPSRTVVWAAGVRASPLLRELGAPLHVDGRVLVDPDLSLPGHPEVYVVGDAAAVRDADGAFVPATAPPALQMGRHAARNVRRRWAGRPTDAYRYRHKGLLAAIGRGFAVADLPRARLAGGVAWLVWALVHVAFLIGFRNKAAVLLEWAWAYLTDRRSARLILDEVAGPDGARPSSERATGLPRASK